MKHDFAVSLIRCLLINIEAPKQRIAVSSFKFHAENLQNNLDNYSLLWQTGNALIDKSLTEDQRLYEQGSMIYFLPIYRMFDPMSDLAGGGASDDENASYPAPPSSAANGRKFADELHSITIHAKQRTFYIDLKQSSNGKFFKVSEKSRGGQKTTIMFDSEDLDKFIEALKEMKNHV